MKKPCVKNTSVAVALTMTLCAVPGVAMAAEPGEPSRENEVQSEDTSVLQDALPEAGAVQAEAGEKSPDTTTGLDITTEALEKSEDSASAAVDASAGEAVTGEDAVAEEEAAPAAEVSSQGSAPTVTEDAGGTQPQNVAADDAQPSTAEAVASVEQAAASSNGELAAEDRAEADDVVEIPDEALRELVAESLGKDSGSEITKRDLLQLREIDAMHSALSGKKVRSLEGLQYAKNLEVLNLNENSVSDLAPISGLTNLRELSLVRNEVHDLSPIAGLTKLTSLDFYYNHVTDISAVANFKDLEFLDMHACNRCDAIGSIEPLSGLTKLRYLSIESNQISDISCLKDVAQSMADAVTGEEMENPPTFLVRVNNITDLSVLKPLLDKKYVELGGIFEGNDIEKKVIVGTINQSGSPIDRHVSDQGGEIVVTLPDIKGFEDVDRAIAGMFGVDTVRVVGIDDDSGTYSLEVRDGKAYITVAANEVGRRRDETIRLTIGYEGTDFIYYLPINVTQDVTYQVTDTSSREGRVIGFELDSTEASTDPVIHFDVTDAEGNPVELESVQVSFPGRAALGESQEGFVAKNLRMEGSGFSFDLGRDADVPTARGTYELRPTVTFKVKGSDRTYEFPEYMYTIKNVTISETPQGDLESTVVFDFNRSNEDGSYTSEALPSEVPFDQLLKIHYVSAYDKNGERLDEPIVDSDGLKLTLTKDQIMLLDHIVLSVSRRNGTSLTTLGLTDADVLSTSNLYPRLRLVLRKIRNSWSEGLKMDGWTEGDYERDPSADSAYGDVTYRYYDSDGNELPGKPHAAGTYFVRAYVREGFEYEGLESEPVAFTIAAFEKSEEPTAPSQDSANIAPTVVREGAAKPARHFKEAAVSKAAASHGGVPKTSDATNATAGLAALLASLGALATSALLRRGKRN